MRIILSSLIDDYCSIILRRGRIIVFSVGEEEDRKLDQVAALHTVGGVLSLATLPDRIAAGVMSNVHLYSLSASKEGSSEGAAELKLESSHAGFVMSLYMVIAAPSKCFTIFPLT